MTLLLWLSVALGNLVPSAGQERARERSQGLLQALKALAAQETMGTIASGRAAISWVEGSSRIQRIQVVKSKYTGSIPFAIPTGMPLAGLGLECP